MKRILLSGCNGKMGRNIAACVRERNDCTIVAGIDISGTVLDAFPVFTSPAECSVEADVIIDFSHPNALSALLDYAILHKLPAVIATTGLSSSQIDAIHAAAEKIPVFFTANMSLGVNLLAELAKKAAAVLGDQFDIEIIEKHHNQKIDAPSGTALMLADAISSVLLEPPAYVYDRHAVRKKRSKNEIGIHAVRGGTIVGEHEILFAGHDETITISHAAASKGVFATGSINAAMFLCEKEKGLYHMGDLV
ncbi:MAG: 4-hydroxy-tetrahydrodipicolinate reductase [Anaerotruncus sp.]|nr:4-hydroxy-tetrahydrodipicolinate reductase [Anaerotruncus sp.]